MNPIDIKNYIHDTTDYLVGKLAGPDCCFLVCDLSYGQEI
jgi:hypothetical protein